MKRMDIDVDAREISVFSKREVMKKGHSLRAAINAYCRDCIYDPLDRGNWRQQVTACEIPDCPLYPVRPRSSAPLEDAKT